MTARIKVGKLHRTGTPYTRVDGRMEELADVLDAWARMNDVGDRFAVATGGKTVVRHPTERGRMLSPCSEEGELLSLRGNEVVRVWPSGYAERRPIFSAFWKRHKRQEYTDQVARVLPVAYLPELVSQYLVGEGKRKHKVHQCLTNKRRKH